MTLSFSNNEKIFYTSNIQVKADNVAHHPLWFDSAAVGWGGRRNKWSAWESGVTVDLKAGR